MSKSSVRTARARALDSSSSFVMADAGAIHSYTAPETAHPGTVGTTLPPYPPMAPVAGAQPATPLPVFPTEVLPLDGSAKPAGRCDLCHAPLETSQLQATEGDAHLCAPCFKQFTALPQGKIRQCLERFMLGNVV